MGLKVTVGRCLASLVILTLGQTSASSAASERRLSFEERVRAQTAIERVYYSHLAGATSPFEQAVPREIIEAKVRAYLGKSQALEAFWNTPITVEMLARELERMNRQTRMPNRLRELYAALGWDSFLAQECLARSVLADRLARRFFARDPYIHRAAHERAVTLRERLVRADLDPYADFPSRLVEDLSVAGDEDGPQLRAVAANLGGG